MRIPGMFVPIGEAVIEAATVWHRTEIEKAGMTVDEFTLLARYWFARTRVARSERSTTKDLRMGVRRAGASVYVTDEDRRLACPDVEVSALRDRGRALADVPEKAWDQLRERLIEGAVRGYIFDESGRHHVPPRAWESAHAEPAHELGAMRIQYGQSMIEGPAAIERAELQSALSGTAPDNDALSAREQSPLIAGKDGGSAEATAKGRRQPKRDLATRALIELFPNGVPSDTELPDALLIKKVGEKLDKGFPLSDDTILRAAGRRNG